MADDKTEVAREYMRERRERFHRHLAMLVEDLNTAQLLEIPGVGELLMDALRHRVIMSIQAEDVEDERMTCECGERTYCLACGSCPACGGALADDKDDGSWICQVCHGRWSPGREVE